jgi:catechol 1,2-dioxygenase
MTTTQPSPSAAGSGASATASFRSTGKYRGGTAEQVSPERVNSVVMAILAGVHQAIRDHEVTYPEFQAAKGWMIAVGEGGEWPLFLDVLVEHTVEEVQVATPQGTKGTILGPYHLPGARWLY